MKPIKMEIKTRYIFKVINILFVNTILKTVLHNIALNNYSEPFRSQINGRGERFGYGLLLQW